jgi:hypothetical protein
MSRRTSAVVLAALGAALLALAAPPSQAADRSAKAHRAGGKATAASHAPKVKQFLIPHQGGEPTLGITREGYVAVTMGAGCVTSCFGAVQPMLGGVLPGGQSVWMTKDKGRSWQDVSPGLPPDAYSHPVSQDPYLLVDRSAESARMFDIDLNAACNELSFSDDLGQTWVSNPLSCGEPVNDHQTLFTGKPVSSPTINYPRIVYYCFNKVAYTDCTKSLDGGLTFLPTANDPNQLACSGLNGHGVTDSRGWIYLPYTGCGSSPTLAISKDEGTTWSTVVVAKDSKVNGGDPSVAVDKKDNVYYVWNDAARRPVLATSKNGGASWSRPMDIGAPGVARTNLVTLAVGAPGKIAFAYYGTGADSDKGAFWNGYIGEGLGVLGKNPLFWTASVNDPAHPLKSHDCGPGRCGRVLDFIDVEIAPDGHPWATYVDACREVCEATGKTSLDDNMGIVGALTGGSNLRR